MHLIIFLSLQEKGKHSMEKDNEQQTLDLEIYGLFLDDCDLLIRLVVYLWYKVHVHINNSFFKTFFFTPI